MYNDHNLKESIKGNKMTKAIENFVKQLNLITFSERVKNSKIVKRMETISIDEKGCAVVSAVKHSLQSGNSLEIEVSDILKAHGVDSFKKLKQSDMLLIIEFYLN